jgi:hypothetical protein
MSDSFGGDHGPVFVDLHGTAGRLGLSPNGSGGSPGDHGFDGPPHPDGPFWLRGLRGKLPLWAAFWGGFFFGHGIVLALSVGIVLIAVVIGMTVDPQNIGESFSTAFFIIVPVAVLWGVFGAWASISVWRSAGNAEARNWAFVARVIVVLYLITWGMTLYHVL